MAKAPRRKENETFKHIQATAHTHTHMQKIYPHPYNQTYFITLFSTAFRGVCHTAIIHRLMRIGVWRWDIFVPVYQRSLVYRKMGVKCYQWLIIFLIKLPRWNLYALWWRCVCVALVGEYVNGYIYAKCGWFVQHS